MPLMTNQSDGAFTMRPHGSMVGSFGNCSDPKQWKNWEEVVLRREKIARNKWYGPEARRREYNMETRKWSAMTNERAQTAAEIIQLPAVGNAAFDRGDNDGALLAYTAYSAAATAQLDTENSMSQDRYPSPVSRTQSQQSSRRGSSAANPYGVTPDEAAILARFSHRHAKSRAQRLGRISCVSLLQGRFCFEHLLGSTAPASARLCIELFWLIRVLELLLLLLLLMVVFA